MDKKSLNNTVMRQEIASRLTDPTFVLNLRVLPNPDEVLRRLGKSQEVYASIMCDAHVLGELRSKRNGLFRREWALRAGAEDSASIRALEICNLVMAKKPWSNGQWQDLFWNIETAIYYGHRVHEVTWDLVDGVEIPASVKDRPNRRFHFGPENELRLKTRSNMVEGEEVEPFKFLLTTHMAEHDNPYGIALLSACYWPWVFKTTGFEYFVKFCERYGFPWAVGKYPAGTEQKEINQLVDGLAQMVEDSVGAVPDNGSIDVHQFSSSGQLVHEQLVKLCNIEMSKALSQQSLSMEIEGKGSYSASQTNKERENDGDCADQALVENTMNELFAWITERNVLGATPPTIEFFEEEQPSSDWAEVIEKARGYLDVPVDWAHERLKIPLATAGQAILSRPVTDPVPPEFNLRAGYDFRAKVGISEDQILADADALLAVPDSVTELLENASTLEEFRDGLAAAVPGITSTEIAEFTQLVLTHSAIQGLDSNA